MAMTPANRGRKNNRPALTLVTTAPDERADQVVDTGELVNAALMSTDDLLLTEDPLNVEVIGAGLVSLSGSEAALTARFVPEVEARGTSEALALLLAVGSVAGQELAEAASAAVGRLIANGVAQPVWTAALHEPLTVTGCSRLTDTPGRKSLLTCSFHRAGHTHSLLMTRDHLDCGAAVEVLLLEAGQVPHAFELARADAHAAGFGVTEEKLDTAEFRRQFESALALRDSHEVDDYDEDFDPIDPYGNPTYRTMAVLTRAWLRTFPLSNRPLEPHVNCFDLEFAPLALAVAPTYELELPEKRKAADRPAPVFQLKISLRGAKPPIWRRLEVPADIDLARLHRVIQTAFGWQDSHLHVFETDYGEFGIEDAELGHHAEEPVELEQIAPGAGEKIRYTYDFGDDWVHDILVEKVLARDETATYPRCTGGRRAAPPEDCGGISGYADLLAILADPSHPEHQDRLEWLGLGSFDPAAFDAKEVTRALG